MPKVLILYYSRTGNTEKMAKAVAEGVKSLQNTEVELTYRATPEMLAGFDAIAIGMPTYHHDMTTDVKKLFEEAAVKNVNLKGKVGAAFGSYGWSGEAPKMVLEIMKNKFEMNVIEPPLLIKYTPDQAGLEKCRELGRKIAGKIAKP
ncbi:MAG: flavodoxin domain-containing protein [Nitrososphaerota archaeon]|nr:flavodoxin domain-containing protein [Candidatus Bathyarchaeota archaeon]MDW8023617.1 flavodoxin domain-containing protein [Nitrososphaerota archaeon]